MLDQILNITEQNLDQAQTQKQILNNDRMKPVLFSVLCEIKERSVLSLRNMQDQNPPNPDLMRLDNMLIAEQIVDGNPQDQTTIENSEYKKKLEQIQRIYKQEIEKHNQGKAIQMFFLLLCAIWYTVKLQTVVLKKNSFGQNNLSKLVKLCTNR